MTTFKISQMDRDTDSGFVRTVHWNASQVDGEFSASTYSTMSFTKEDGITLIPYDELTEQLVIGWVVTTLGEDGVAAVDAALAQNIADQKAPKVAAGVPWSE
ncbi:hypothetical protein UFOVP415_41 [uncultured Caudovirales phage]|uniref:DUF7936 domain-containing protein n=1 Tax=uncultured Caudovirales phage TaxID=2100421 RepID=A0A6J5MCT8_9CAUD|nr:hypothetical protein UFOVP415_41 [uncultured Caudovirales phage]